MQHYIYYGPVLEFDALIVERWEASTFAASEKKARSNLTYQFKKKNNRLPSAKIKLPGKMIMED